MIPRQPHPDGETESSVLKRALRRVFDSQIPNYGDYNLVFGANVRHEVTDAGGQRVTKAKYFVIGYRWQPSELMIAPVKSATLTGGGIPVEINITNLVHAVQLAGGDYEVGTSTGKTFRFGVQPWMACHQSADLVLTLDQAEDHTDFELFMQTFVRLAGP